MADKQYVPVKPKQEAKPGAHSGPTLTDAAKMVAGTGLRVGGTIGGSLLGGLIGGPTVVGAPAGVIAGGAAGSAAGESLAEWLLEGKQWDPKRIAAAAGLGAVPGSWLVRTGKPAVSAALGALFGYGSGVASKVAAGDTVTHAADPRNLSGLDLLGMATGAGMGGIAGLRGHGAPAPKTGAAPIVSGKPDPKTTEGLLQMVKEIDQAKGSTITPDLKNYHEILASELDKNPNGPTAQAVRGKNAPDNSILAREKAYLESEKVNTNEAASDVQINEEGLKAQTKKKTDEIKKLNEGFKASGDAEKGLAKVEAVAEKAKQKGYVQEAKNETAREKYVQKENVQQARNLNARDKFLEREAKGTDKAVEKELAQREKDAAQEARNLNARDKYLRTVEKDRAAADVENAARTDKGIAQANAEHQQDKIDEFLSREDVKPNDPTVVQTARGKSDIGEDLVHRQGFHVETPAEGGEGGGAAPIAGSPAPAPRPLDQRAFWTRAEAARAGRDAGLDPSEWQVVGKGNEWRLTKKLQGPELDNVPGMDEPPPAAPIQTEPPKPKGGGGGNGVTKAMEKQTPWGKLDVEDRNAIAKILVDRKMSGKIPADASPEDLADLANELADKLSMIREGNAAATEAGTAPNTLIKMLAKSGKKIYDDGSEEVKNFKQLVGASWAKRIFTKNSENALTGDQVLNDLVKSEDGKFPQLKQARNFYDMLEQMGAEFRQAKKSNGKGVTDFDELSNSLHPEWPNKPTSDPVLTEDGYPASWDLEPEVHLAPEVDNPVPPAGGPGAKSAKFEESSNPAFDSLMDDLHPGDETPRINPQGHGTLPAEQPELSVQDFATALNKEGEKPIAEVPFGLQQDVAPQAPPPQEGGLFGDEPPAAAPILAPPKPKAPSGSGGALFEPETVQATEQANQAADLAAARAAGPRLVKKTPEQTLAPTEPVAPVEEAGAAPLRFFNSPLEAAGENYGAVKAAKKAGEAVPEEGRRLAGMAAQDETTKFAQEVASGARSVDEIEKLPAQSQQAVWQRLKRIISEQGGQVSLGPMAHIGSGLIGGAYGAATDDEDPLRGALLYGAAGAAAPSVISGLMKGLRANPQLVEDSQKGSTLSTLGQMIPEWQRFSLLMNPPNLIINTAVGPWGAGVMGSLEKGLAGDKRGLESMKNFFNPKNFGLDTLKGSWGEAQLRIKDANERTEGQMGKVGPEWFRKLTSFPGELMTAGDVAARNNFTNAGFSSTDARKMTLTNEPEHAWSQGFGAWKKAKTEGGKTSIFRQVTLPFYRTGINQMERSLERTPGLGFFAQNWKDVPDPLRDQIAQQGLGLGVAAGNGILGYNNSDADPRDPNQRVLRKFLNEVQGPYGALGSVAYTAGQALGQGKSIPGMIGSVTNRLFTGDIPMPTPQPVLDLLGILKDRKPGDPIRLPSGVVPAIVNPSSPFSIFSQGAEEAPTDPLARPTYVPVRPK